jgi:hypothetical protein
MPSDADTFLVMLHEYFTHFYIGDKWSDAQIQAHPARRNLRWTLLKGKGNNNLWIEVKCHENDIFVHIATKNPDFLKHIDTLEPILPAQINGYSKCREKRKCTRLGYKIVTYAIDNKTFALISHIVNKLAIEYFKHCR